MMRNFRLHLPSRHFGFIAAILVVFTLGQELSCSAAVSTPVVSEKMDLLPASAEDMIVEKRQDAFHHQLSTTGSDPHVLTLPLTQVRPEEAVVLTFEYKSNASLAFIQVFLADPISETRSFKSDPLSAAGEWRQWSVVLKKQLSMTSWGHVGDYLRLDFGDQTGFVLEMRNMYLRSMTADEIEQERQAQEKQQEIERFDRNVQRYLAADFPCSVTEVDAGLSAVTIRGICEGSGNYLLCEIPPYRDVTESNVSDFKTALHTSLFRETFDRYVMRNHSLYDRTLSKWVIVKETDGCYEVVSHARYADRIEPSQVTVAQKPVGKKGIGDIQNHAIMIRDITDLGLTSATLNFRITTFMYSEPGDNRIEHRYGGNSYYFDRRHVEQLDTTLIACRDRNVVVAGIILITPAARSCDPVIGGLLQHPDYTSEGNYSMPNMSCAESVATYAAALDFLASRYCRADRQYGRIHHWILHNEVDSGLEWTNMGPDKPIHVYMDQYVKSMRMCYHIVRRYDAYSEVFASHTHAWAVASNRATYASRTMLQILNDYGRAEGDFQWGVAFHCYPYDLHEPRTWLDPQTTYTQDSPIITYKNLEVLSDWAQLPANKYKGTNKRTVWLSENGTNSRSYSEEAMRDQAAGFAWGWKKINALDGIDAHQWHNWADNETEYGLRIGLRKFAKDRFECKEIWRVYQAAGTSSEEAVFAKYLSVIGISDWKIRQCVEGSMR